MNDYCLVQDKIGKLLRQHRFVLIRQGKHLVWQSPERRIFVCSKTPSDWRAERNMITAFNHVISTPPQPMVIAISDFERQEAAEKIAGQQRQQQARAGMGSGKQHRSNGTGYKYYDANEPLTEEEIRAREQAAIKAQEAAKSRRERKLQRRQERQTKRDEAQKQILLAHINEMLKQIQPSSNLPITVKDEFERRNLFKSTVGKFADSFEKLRWQEIEDVVAIIFGTRNDRAIARFTKLRNNTNNSFTVLNEQRLLDGTKTIERRECHDWIIFNEVRLPDGTRTATRVEHRNGGKDFNLKRLPDGTGTIERAELFDGQVQFNVAETADGIRTIGRVEFPDGEIHFSVTKRPDGTTTARIVRWPDGTEEVDVEL